MATTANFAEIAALAGDPARAGMLHALMDGRALTATELANAASVTPQTASGHLARMSTAGLLGFEEQGRHHYFRLASPAVAQMIESIMQVASVSDAAGRPVVVGPRDAALRAARVVCRPCLDWSERRPHLAGGIGAALCTHSFANDWIRRLPGTRAVAVTPKGQRVFREQFGAHLWGG